MKPFDLTAAISGAPVVTRDGREVSQLTKFEVVDRCQLRGVIGNEIYPWYSSGKMWAEDEDSLDLFMREEEPEVWEATMELRWENRAVPLTPHTVTCKNFLQQKHTCGTDPIKVKWVDVPTVGEEA